MLGMARSSDSTTKRNRGTSEISRSINEAARGHGLTFNVGERRVEGYTNFLWTVMMVPSFWIGLPVHTVSLVLGTLWSLGLAMARDERVTQRTAYQFILRYDPAFFCGVPRDDALLGLLAEDVVAAERATLETISRNEGKPEAALPKIVEGRINGFFKDVALLDQPYAKDDKQSVSQFIGGATIVNFAQVEIG